MTKAAKVQAKRNREKGEMFQGIDEFLKERFPGCTQANRAFLVGRRQPNYSKYLNNGSGRRVIKGICEKIYELGGVNLIQPIFEFRACRPHPAGTVWKLLGGTKEEQVEEGKIKNALEGKHGVYAMYDSTGRILYFGKNGKGGKGAADLYTEICQRLGGRNGAKLPSDVVFADGNGRLQHCRGKMDVGQLVCYFSAYEIRNSSAAIKTIESFVLHLIPNDLHVNRNLGKLDNLDWQKRHAKTTATKAGK